MVHYVAFAIGPDGHFMAVRDVWAANHAEAMEQAKSMLGQFVLELWCRGRWIATLPANAAPRNEDIDRAAPDEPPSSSGAGGSAAGGNPDEWSGGAAGSATP